MCAPENERTGVVVALGLLYGNSSSLQTVAFTSAKYLIMEQLNSSSNQTIGLKARHSRLWNKFSFCLPSPLHVISPTNQSRRVIGQTLDYAAVMKGLRVSHNQKNKSANEV